jgi:hypothetical protein
MNRIRISKNIYIATKRKKNLKNVIYLKVTNKTNEEIFTLPVINNVVSAPWTDIENPQKVQGYLSILKYVKHKFGYTLEDNALKCIGFVPVTNDFMNYLMLRFENCDYITINDQSFVNIRKSFKERLDYSSLNDLSVLKANKFKLNINRWMIDFLIDNHKYYFICYLHDFYFPQINVITELKTLQGFSPNDPFRKLRILLNYSPVNFLYKNKEETLSFIKTRLCKEPLKLIDLNNMPDWNAPLYGQTGSGHSWAMNQLLSFQLSGNKILRDQSVLNAESKISDLHLKFASQIGHYDGKVAENVS